ncbi:MAG TPA: DUF1003 domain-containing protein [Rhizomicrobium sp.]|jgi:uncharacterized membrane protein|nr:DUF1003 domain-containing protein [Rhizomicrobium sp.]
MPTTTRRERHAGSSRAFRGDSNSGLAQVLERNIRALQQRHRKEEARATTEERVACVITDFTGSMLFVYLHVAIFGAWIVLNLRWVPGIPAWDPSFVILAMIASVEAIFLSTFVLITQNRMAAAAERRAELDLQINLLAEHEVTKLIRMVSAIAGHLNVPTEAGSEIEELKSDIAPEAVLDEIEQAE